MRTHLNSPWWLLPSEGWPLRTGEAATLPSHYKYYEFSKRQTSVSSRVPPRKLHGQGEGRDKTRGVRSLRAGVVGMWSWVEQVGRPTGIGRGTGRSCSFVGKLVLIAAAFVTTFFFYFSLVACCGRRGCWHSDLALLRLGCEVWGPFSPLL